MIWSHFIQQENQVTERALQLCSTGKPKGKPQMSLRKSMLILIAIAMVTVLGRTSPGQAGDLSAGAPNVPKNIHAGSRYRAVITLRKKKGVRITSVNWYWSGEGPFRYPFNGSAHAVSARLITRNPGTYLLSARVCFVNAQGRSGCVKTRSKRIRVR